MKTSAWLLAGVLFVPSIALAHDCPNLMRKVDEILASRPSLDEETIVDEDLHKNVKQLRAEGEALHGADKHDESLDLLKRALTLLENEV